MTYAFRPIAMDLLSQAIERVRRDLDRSIPLHQRARNFWAGVLCARNLAAADVVIEDFQQLAAETGLISDLTHGKATVEHLINWAIAKRNPFGKAS
jgi:hypothetical protein